MFTVPKILYGIVIAVAVVVAVIYWPIALSIVYIVFPILVLLMLWDIMSAMNKLWRKLWEIDGRLADLAPPYMPPTSS